MTKYEAPSHIIIFNLLSETAIYKFNFRNNFNSLGFCLIVFYRSQPRMDQ